MQFNTLMLSQGSGSSHQHHKSYQPWFSSPGAAIGAQSSAWSQPQSSHPSFEVPKSSNASTLPQNSMQFNTLMLSQGSGSSHQHHKSYQPWFSSSAATIGAQSSAWSQPQSSHPSFEVPRKCVPRKQQCFNVTSEFHAVQHFDVVSREWIISSTPQIISTLVFFLCSNNRSTEFSLVTTTIVTS
ncbi:hypothetical protein JHK85_022300 [Glycine max]|nr:hypothetical protein JHK87_021759 [Glycine soja]KAG5016164.1 hypothetical protein JHK85_022300 [Glycine max]